MHELRVLRLQPRGALRRQRELVLQVGLARARAVALELHLLQARPPGGRLVALPAVGREQLLALVLLGLDHLLEVGDARDAALHLLLLRLRLLAVPLQLLVEDLVLADHLAQVVRGRRELGVLRRRLAAQLLLGAAHALEPRAQVDHLRWGQGQGQGQGQGWGQN